MKRLSILQLLGSSKVSSKGQVTIPIKARKILKIEPEVQVGFYLDEGRVIIQIQVE